MPTRVIFDTDPGVDDAMAIFFLLRSPELRLDALTTVYGNVDVEQTTRNALVILDVAGRADVPVVRGADRPLLRERRTGGAAVHGDNGLGGAGLPAPSRSAGPGRAAETIVERVLAAPGEITLVAVGPLTNLALAVRLEPRIAEAVREVVIMGGAATVPGNVSPVAEANIANDPEAAWIVFHAGWPLAMVGLDVTLQAIITPDDIREIEAAGHPDGAFIRAISAHYGDHYARRTGKVGFPMHDSAAVLYAIDPGYFRTERWYVDVETGGARSAGHTIPDRRGQWGHRPNATVCVGIDDARFLALYKERLMRA
jgi:purine nucleosidase